MLRCKAKEAEWCLQSLGLCVATVLRPSQPCPQAHLRDMETCPEPIRHCWESHWLVPCARGQGAHLGNCSALACPLQVASQVGRGAGPEALEHSVKHHYVGHLALPAQWLHCRAGATYLDEDFVGRIKHVAQKASGGGLVHTTSIVLQKWRKGTWLRWEACRT